MNCPKCKGKTKVIDSRPTDRNTINRRHECTDCKNRFTTVEIIADELGIYVEYAKKRTRVINAGSRGTLCWKCKNAYGQCSWSSEFQAVDGWDAKPTIIRNLINGEERNIDSFDVKRCPLFIKDRT